MKSSQQSQKGRTTSPSDTSPDPISQGRSPLRPEVEQPGTGRCHQDVSAAESSLVGHKTPNKSVSREPSPTSQKGRNQSPRIEYNQRPVGGQTDLEKTRLVLSAGSSYLSWWTGLGFGLSTAFAFAAASTTGILLSLSRRARSRCPTELFLV